MPQQRSRTRAVIPGKMILGAAGAAAAERKTVGGAVVPGRKILGDAAAQEQAIADEAKKKRQAAGPAQAKGPKPKPEAKPTKSDAVPPLKSPQQEARDQKRPPALSLSEHQAI